MGEAEINAFLTYLAIKGNVATNTQNQNQAFSAILFLYRHVLKDLDFLRNKVTVREGYGNKDLALHGPDRLPSAWAGDERVAVRAGMRAGEDSGHVTQAVLLVQ